MVVGNGMIAGAFSKFLTDDKVLIFASGVSNSKETDILQYEREKILLMHSIKNNKDKLIIYFSTCSIYDPVESQSLYSRHKVTMEDIVMRYCKRFLVFRVSNVVGKTKNNFIIFNYLVNCIKQKIQFELWKNAYRNIIDIQDVFDIATYIIQSSEFHNKIMNVANVYNYSVPYLVEEIENFFQANASYTIKEKGQYFEIDCDEIKKIIIPARVNFSENYIQKLLNKYYNE